MTRYLEFTDSTIPEWEFLATVAKRTGCGVLLDINNVFVSGSNHRFDPEKYIETIPRDSVWQFHLAGHSDYGTHRLDTHDHPVLDEVWALYRKAVERFGDVPTLIEWDGNIPEWERLEQESLRAREIRNDVLGT